MKPKRHETTPPEFAEARKQVLSLLQEGQMPRAYERFEPFMSQYKQAWEEMSKAASPYLGMMQGAASQLLSGQVPESVKQLVERSLEKQMAALGEQYGARGLGFGTDVMRAKAQAAREAALGLGQMGYEGYLLGTKLLPSMVQASLTPAELRGRLALGASEAEARRQAAAWAPWLQTATQWSQPVFTPSEAQQILQSLLSGAGIAGAIIAAA